MRWLGRIFWLLACGLKPFGLTFLPPSPLVKNCRRHACLYNDWLVGNRIQLQQRNCSGFAPDFSRRSTVSNSQRTKRAIAACASASKLYFVRRVFRARTSPVLSPDAKLNLLVTGGAGFLGSNLALELQR